jgi:hypothetical protein
MLIIPTPFIDIHVLYSEKSRGFFINATSQAPEKIPCTQKTRNTNVFRGESLSESAVPPALRTVSAAANIQRFPSHKNEK